MRLWKFDTAKQGALRIEFSNMGKWLAIACTMENNKTIIKIVDVEMGGTEKVVLRGHHDLIHDLHWSQNDEYLVSASADGSAKVWELGKDKKQGNPDVKNYTENDGLFFLEQLLHPSYVYAARIFPDIQMSGRD